MRRKVFLAAAVAAALAIGVGGGTVFASRGQAQRTSITSTKPLVTSGGAPCAMATVASRTQSTLSTSYTKVVAVTIKKRCAGPLTALLTAQSAGPDGGNSQVVVGAKVTCIGKGGFLHPCTKGGVHWAVPAGDPGANNQECLNCWANDFQANAINLSFPGLPAGIYKIQVVARGDSSSNQIGYRTLQAIAWSQG